MGTPGKQQTRQRQPARSLPVWQRLLLGGYSALFALLLPLICWGAVAEPGHPHRYPHFVFADPILNRVERSSKALWLVSGVPIHHRTDHEAASLAQTGAVCPLRANGAIAGRATPMLMVFSILSLIFLRPWAIRRLDRLHFALWPRPHFPESLLLLVPLPPPRLLLSPVSRQA